MDNIIGVLSDTHNIPNIVIESIIKDMKKRGVGLILHCGDININHVSAKLFGNIPVMCALVEGQENDPVFEKKKPKNWTFTRPNNRIIILPNGTKIYLGHRIHLNFLRTSEDKFDETLTDLREKNDGLRYVFGGHLHFQTLKQGQLVTFINPGAVKDALGWGYEYSILDTHTGQIVFCRILPTEDQRKIFSIAVISDSSDVTKRDKSFWSKLAKELLERDVSHIIHCGNIDFDDIGRPELKDFIIHYAIRQDQQYAHSILKKINNFPSNWTVISEENLNTGSVVEINGYRFYVQLDLGLKYMSFTEHGMDTAAMQIRREHPETTFVLCGFTRQALYVEGQQVSIINPGDINIDRSFAVICFPRQEIAFGSVPCDLLPGIPGV